MFAEYRARAKRKFRYRDLEPLKNDEIGGEGKTFQKAACGNKARFQIENLFQLGREKIKTATLKWKTEPLSIIHAFLGQKKSPLSDGC